MNLMPVNSSRMNAVGWEDNTMYIRFNDGAIYAYSNVSQSEYKSFLSSSSLGHELVSFQRLHPYRKVG